jgi:hypothetical protein
MLKPSKISATAALSTQDRQLPRSLMPGIPSAV